MKSKKFFSLLTALVLAALIPGCSEEDSNSRQIKEAPENLSIGRMRVAIWPEYDDRSVLAIYDGKFEDASDFPLKTSFLIPKGAIINDACSLSVGGQHFCQLYKTVNKGEYDEVRLLLPYPNFYLSFHTLPIDVEKPERTLSYQIKASHAIQNMEVDIQQPLRAEGFNITPTSSKSFTDINAKQSERKGFNHFSYLLEDVSKNQESTFQISYVKTDPKPSVDIKFSKMDGAKVFGSPYATQKNAKTIVYIMFGTSALGLAALITGIVIYRRKKQREPLG